MPLFSEGFLLGLSTGFFCLTACLPVLLPYLLSEGGRGWKADFAVLGEFLAGRALAYFLFAVISASIGKGCNPYLPAWLAPLVMLLTASAMLAFLLRGRHVVGDKCRAVGASFYGRLPLALGFMTGINICPPFVAAFVRLVAIGDPAAGLIYFSGFFSATSVFLLPVLLPSPFINARLRNIGRMAMFLSAVWYFFLGLKGLLGGEG